MNTQHINAIIIENDIAEAHQIKAIIEQECPNITITAIGCNPIETQNVIQTKTYDMIIMRQKTGIAYAFKMLENAAIDFDEKELILISTQEEHYIQKFTKAAVGSILPPYDSEGIQQAVQKATQSITHQKEATSFLQQTSIQPKPLNLLAIPSTDDVKILKISDILYLQSEGKYTVFHTTHEKKIVSSTNLGEYEKKLAYNNFFRIHNSFLVNMDNIVNVQKRDGVYIEMNNREMIPVAKRKKDPLFQFLGIK